VRDGFVVGGMAKGAAMLAPNMATMLAVLTTDAAADSATLKKVLVAGVDDSFNALVVDGCTSTNDTVLLLASGAAGPADPVALAEAVAEVCLDLASQMAGDAEGHTKVVRLRVTGAASNEDARAGARKVAESALVKCSWYGQDPYWGRIASELGVAGIDFEQSKLSVTYGPHVVARDGISVDHDVDGLRAYMANPQLDITADLGLGGGAARVLTNDLSHAYVDENMGTS
jgi:glutamate N-acetyltransferase/amino-acid N-acetyltransferase